MLFKKKKKDSNKKSFIIYFSRADENYAVGWINKGNTEIIAEYVQEFTNADMFKVEPKVPYPKDYNKCLYEAKQRQELQKAPIVQKVPDISDYEIIYIGTPIYWDIMPEEMATALYDIDFSGKIIRPFVTHEGSGLGSVPIQIKALCKKASIKEGLAIRGSNVANSKDLVKEWTEKITI